MANTSNGKSLQLASPKRWILGAVGGLAKLFLNHYCRAHVFNKHKLVETVLTNTSRPVITVANHSSVLDDPSLWGILPWRILLHRKRMRWSLGAKEICFSTAATSWFFASGRVIPIVRGDGIYQPAMDLAIQKLKNNEWVHIFSEGKVNQDPVMLPFRWGIARLILASNPIIIPIWHQGMEAVMPEKTKIYFPRCRKDVVVSIGDPVDLSANGILEAAKRMDEREARIFITDYVFQQTLNLQKQTQRLMGEPKWKELLASQQKDAAPPRHGDPS
ncbi:hypothetical protein HDU85_003150 [Gaertneriomyces sp. JEL0708]|nr:hypothetical protein HDU85_003150 [Gaertneriomyces sp. JEL0708]